MNLQGVVDHSSSSTDRPMLNCVRDARQRIGGDVALARRAGSGACLDGRLSEHEVVDVSVAAVKFKSKMAASAPPAQLGGYRMLAEKRSVTLAFCWRTFAGPSMNWPPGDRRQSPARCWEGSPSSSG